MRKIEDFLQMTTEDIQKMIYEKSKEAEESLIDKTNIPKELYPSIGLIYSGGMAGAIDCIEARLKVLKGD